MNGSLATDLGADTSSQDASARAGQAVRVLHVINGEHYAGAERVQDLLAAALPSLGFEVGFACVKPGAFSVARQARQTPLYEFPMRGKFNVGVARQLARVVRQGGYRILHAHTPRTLLVAGVTSLQTGLPLVYHVHSPASRDSTRPWRNRVNAAVEWLGLSRASAVIAVSNSLAEHVRKLGRFDRKLSVVLNGVPGREPGLHARPVPEAWTLGTVALFRPRKGIEILLEALASLRANGLPVRLRAVGGFETARYEQTVKGLADKLELRDAIDWTGFTANVNAELDKLDLLVLPSLFGEGLPMVVLEAMAAGVPIVATRVEGIPEAIRDGQEGLLAEPGNSKTLAAAISRVVRSEADWASMRARAIKRHADAFSDRRMAEGVAAVYERVLTPNRPATR